MGLDFSHGDAHWSYGGFHRARKKLAAAIGVELDQMQGFAPMLELRGSVSHANISWDTVRDDIVLLLRHSDCDGDLSPEECRQVAPRLRELIQHWPEDDHDKIHFERLAAGMDTAAARCEPLEFC